MRRHLRHCSTHLLATTFTIALSLSGTPAWADTAQARLAESATILKEIMATPDQSIPEDLLKSAYCVVIVPGVKNVGFVVGGKYGRGFAVCRKDPHSSWGAPAAVRIEGGSVGFQIGASSTDLVLFFMREKNIRDVLNGEFTLGGSATVAAGPVRPEAGRDAAADGPGGAGISRGAVPACAAGRAA